jgi:hypothetical protein
LVRITFSKSRIDGAELAEHGVVSIGRSIMDWQNH